MVSILIFGYLHIILGAVILRLYGGDNMLLIILFIVLVVFSLWIMLRMASIADQYDLNMNKQ